MGILSGIYSITNVVTGKKYIGSAINFDVRKNRHINELRRQKHHNTKLQNSWNKHGEDKFVFELIESVEDRELLLEREQFWIDSTQCVASGYNIAPLADRPAIIDYTPEVREQMSKRCVQRWSTDDKNRLRVGEMARKQWEDPEYREKMARCQRELDRSYQKESTSNQWKNPEVREKMIAGIKETMSTDEYKTGASARTKELMSKPGVKENLSAKARERNSDPEFAEKFKGAMADRSKNASWMASRHDPNHPGSVCKLSKDQVLEIRASHKDGTMMKDLAAKYNVTPSTINAIVHRRTWKHI